ESALFGTKITDRFFQINVGGDVAFLSGVLKTMVDHDWVDRAFIDAHTTGFADLAEHLGRLDWDELEAGSGTTRAEMQALAELLHQARTAVFVWSMGGTPRESGEANVRALVNL